MTRGEGREELGWEELEELEWEELEEPEWGEPDDEDESGVPRGCVTNETALRLVAGPVSRQSKKTSSSERWPRGCG